MVDGGVNHQAAARLKGCQLCKPVAPAGLNAPPMPVPLPPAAEPGLHPWGEPTDSLGKRIYGSR